MNGTDATFWITFHYELEPVQALGIRVNGSGTGMGSALLGESHAREFLDSMGTRDADGRQIRDSGIVKPRSPKEDIR